VLLVDNILQYGEDFDVKEPKEYDQDAEEQEQHDANDRDYNDDDD
jgi:hypothetical protein